MPFSGDLSRMGQLADRLADLSEVPSRAAKRVAEGLSWLVAEEFATGADPYGKAWKPLAEATLARRSQTSAPPLTDFGLMRASVSVRPQRGAGVAIRVMNPPAAPHQTGWSGVQGSGPARPILPYRGMPEEWEELIEGAVDAAMRERR
jgi:hypothetical protein